MQVNNKWLCNVFFLIINKTMEKKFVVEEKIVEIEEPDEIEEV